MKRFTLFILLSIFISIIFFNCHVKKDYYSKSEINNIFHSLGFKINNSNKNRNNNEKKYYSKKEIEELLQKYLNHDYAVFEERSKNNSINSFMTANNKFIKRCLNTIVSINGDSIKLDTENNKIILKPGIYKINASAPAYYVTSHQLRLRDLTNNKTILLGTSESASISGIQTRSFIDGVIEIKKPIDLELQHFFNNPQTRCSLGINVSSGEQDVYAKIIIERLNIY